MYKTYTKESRMHQAMWYTVAQIGFIITEGIQERFPDNIEFKHGLKMLRRLRQVLQRLTLYYIITHFDAFEIQRI